MNKYDEMCEIVAESIANKGIALKSQALATIKALTVIHLMAILNNHPNNKALKIT